MADLFTLSGTIAAYPASGSPSADPSIIAPIEEREMLGTVLASQLQLTTDPAVELPFGGMTGVNVVQVKSVGGPIIMRLSTASAADQQVVVDSYAVLLSRSTPYTSVSVQRAPGVATTVKFTLGQRAS